MKTVEHTMAKKGAVLKEIFQVLDSFNDDEVDKFVSIILGDYLKRFQRGEPPRKVLCYGAGRMGLSTRAFAMRLNHLGIPAYFFGDTYIPPFTKDDIVVLVSNSGETRTVVSIANAVTAKCQAKIIAITANPNSTLAKYADHIVTFKTCNGGLNSADDPSKINSIQPMTTLTEQSLLIFFDIVVLELIRAGNIDIGRCKAFHSNIE